MVAEICWWRSRTSDLFCQVRVLNNSQFSLSRDTILINCEQLPGGSIWQVFIGDRLWQASQRYRVLGTFGSTVWKTTPAPATLVNHSRKRIIEMNTMVKEIASWNCSNSYREKRSILGKHGNMHNTIGLKWNPLILQSELKRWNRFQRWQPSTSPAPPCLEIEETETCPPVTIGLNFLMLNFRLTVVADLTFTFIVYQQIWYPLHLVLGG